MQKGNPQMRPTSTQRVHRTPKTGGCKTTHAKNRSIVEWCPIPLRCSTSVCEIDDVSYYPTVDPFRLLNGLRRIGNAVSLFGHLGWRPVFLSGDNLLDMATWDADSLAEIRSKREELPKQEAPS